MKLYNDYSSYLKDKYGGKVYRIGLDGGFSCPNRDGTKGYNGCLYCNDNGSRSSYTKPAEDIKTQLASRITYLKKMKSADKFIAYFQAFTSTYAPVDTLKKTYDQIKDFNEIVGLTIGTRPDAVDKDKIKLISSYKNKYEVWLEFGLQSIHNKTLESINRGHTFEDFLAALELSREFDIPVCAHVILGLPGETKKDMIETAQTLSNLKVNAVKIHLLHILKGSPIEKLYKKGDVKVMSQAQYVALACDFLENISPNIIIQRLTGEGDKSNHIAPIWALNKIETINLIGDTLKKRGTHQGIYCKQTII
ncbi:MAG: TIGR01212 family radical SAM protein [Candidatus Omnitrophota bacterium]